MQVSENLSLIYRNIKSSALKVGRNPEDITLIAVTKYVEPVLIKQAIAAGVHHIGENRVQEGIRKFPSLPKEVVKHLIGSLQTNKVKIALEYFDLIHSVERLSLVEELAKQADTLNRQVELLVQVNVSGEAAKHGISPDELNSFLAQIANYHRLIPCGLMTMAPLADNSEEARPIFRRLRELFIDVAALRKYSSHWRYLSMGMSQDYTVAVEEGANLLRVGTAIFKGVNT